MKRKTVKGMIAWMIVATAAAAIIGCLAANAKAHTAKPDPKLLLRQTMRKLWADHVIWTREYIVASVAGSPDAPDAANRLLRNQEDIGEAISFFYGLEASKRFTHLLKVQVQIAMEVVEVAKSGDKGKLEETDKRWHENADEIATFLSGLNKHWPKKDLTQLLYRHLSLTTEEATARIQGNWKEDIAAFDKDFDHIMVVADGFSEGIIKQFTAKFY